MANRFFTVLVVPERTSQVRRFVVPAWIFRGALLGLFFVALLSVIMLLNYWSVMGQIDENKQLKLENRRLKQQVQVFQNKMSTLESTMERVKTFATRLKVITNIEDRGNLIQSLNDKIPDASTNIGTAVAQTSGESKTEPENSMTEAEKLAGTDGEDPETLLLRRDYEKMETKFLELNYKSLLVEQVLQDQYELLADQKAFLAALPTRKPAIGYFTSGFGVRRSPFGGREKMHEGLDIANYPGTTIKATADGVVVHSDIKPGYGQTVIVDHGYGLETWYAHNRKITVKKGQKVHRGDAIAQLGNSGRSTGPHLHYEVRVHGTPVDPLSYILEN